ncbi:MAG: hypothetical protein HOJ57_05780 [Lentisphaerae bacterium]|nr:hypothetical protein [Lentisphaerota bacterium]MBT7060140.1 hypothetical protein [Lentisphaerota bacterium]
MAMTSLLTVSTVGLSAAQPVRVSGVYPHLAAFNSTLDAQGRTSGTGGECGIGAVVPWAGKLWSITYSPHCPAGSNDKLYTIDADMKLDVRPESIGGTPAGRMIHRESQQLFIGPYVIDKAGTVRTIPYSRMNGRHTAVSRHLTDPANKVYYFDMEGRIYEVDVHSLAVTLLFRKPVPGWHGKGGYTGQGRYVITNNGERSVKGHPLKDLLVGGPPENSEDNGVLAEWDGNEWRIIERRQFTEVSGPNGIYGSPDETSPVWAVGWDRRSVVLKLLDGGTWYTYRLPKGTWTYDGHGGWYTEWPRIREIAPGQLMMDMHGIFWDFPKTFSATNSAGLSPMATHHRYVPDFCHWNGQVVLASDDTSIMANPLAGQSESNYWFGHVDEIRTWGPRVGWGGPWVNDPVKAGEPSVPYAIAGFKRRCLHLAVGGGIRAAGAGPDILRCSRRFVLDELPGKLAPLPRVTIARGDYHEPAPGYTFRVDRAVTVYLAVDSRPKIELPGWKRTDMATEWEGHSDHVYQRRFPAGPINIPGHAIPHKGNDYGLPHLCFVEPVAGPPSDVAVTDLPESLGGRFLKPATAPEPIETAEEGQPVTFAVEVDRRGTRDWSLYGSITVPASGYTHQLFPAELEAAWIRLTAERDCVATAHFSYGETGHAPEDYGTLFAALAEVRDDGASAAWIRPGKHNLNLQVLRRSATTGGSVSETYREVNETLVFADPAEDRSQEMRDIAATKQEFSVDTASVILRAKGKRYRLPKGDPRYDRPFTTGWPRGIRECESERYLMNLHGTFYEKPREAGILKIKPVASHGKQIVDFCTWRGLLVVSGTRTDARPDGQFFADTAGHGLWFGAIDDLWKLGKPVGRGGPWKDADVSAGKPSDPYLMTGYDKKTLTLSHNADKPVRVTVEVNVDHTAWHRYRTFSVPGGETVVHEFPEGYDAHWLRVRSDRDCTASAWLVYE